MTAAQRTRYSWISVIVAWLAFAVGAVICVANAREWPAWAACYLVAIVLWFAVPAAIWRWRMAR